MYSETYVILVIKFWTTYLKTLVTSLPVVRKISNELEIASASIINVLYQKGYLVWIENYYYKICWGKILDLFKFVPTIINGNDFKCRKTKLITEVDEGH